MWAEVDISNEEGNQVLIDLATNNWKRLDVFFANAGVIGSYSPLMVENMFFVFVRYVTHPFFCWPLSSVYDQREHAVYLRCQCHRVHLGYQAGRTRYSLASFPVRRCFKHPLPDLPVSAMMDFNGKGVGGSIVATSSVAGLRFGAGTVEYR